MEKISIEEKLSILKETNYFLWAVYQTMKTQEKENNF